MSVRSFCQSFKEKIARCRLLGKRTRTVLAAGRCFGFSTMWDGVSFRLRSGLPLVSESGGGGGVVAAVDAEVRPFDLYRLSKPTNLCGNGSAILSPAVASETSRHHNLSFVGLSFSQSLTCTVSRRRGHSLAKILWELFATREPSSPSQHTPPRIRRGQKKTEDDVAAVNNVAIQSLKLHFIRNRTSILSRIVQKMVTRRRIHAHGLHYRILHPSPACEGRNS